MKQASSYAYLTEQEMVTHSKSRSDFVIKEIVMKYSLLLQDLD
jgi:hypothetical protein